MKDLQKWTLGGALCGALYALVMAAPAAWLASGVAYASAQRVLLQTPSGTVWQGSAHLVLSGGDGSANAVSLPSRLEWRITPAWLGLDVSLSAPCCATAASPIRLGLRASGLAHWQDLQWQLDAPGLKVPAELLMGWGAPWNTLQLTGDLWLTSDHLAGVSSPQGTSHITGRATLQANGMATALSTVRPLGSYRLTSIDTAIQLETVDTAAPHETALLLTGSGRIEQGRLSFQGQAVAAKGREDALANLLHMMGQWQPSADGRARAILKI